MSEYRSHFLSFDNYRIKNFNFRNSNEYVISHEVIELDFKFGVKTSVNENKENASILLSCQIFDEENYQNNLVPFFLEIEVEGFFSSNSDINIDDFQPNAAAILFPYLRSFVSSFTAQSGIPTVTIPPVNVYNMVRDGQ